MREEAEINLNFDLPDGCDVKLFIPGFLYDSNQCCYCVDLKKNKIICWNIDLTEMNILIKRMFEKKDIENANLKFDLNGFLNVMHAVHSVRVYKGSAYVFSNSNYMLQLGLEDGNHDYVIYNNIDKVFSGTNFIDNNKIYFTSWNMFDALNRKKSDDFIPIEIGTYNIDNKDFSVIDTFLGPDNIHQVYFSQDKKSLILVEMGRLLNSTITPEQANSPEMLLKVLKDGPAESHIIKYDLMKKTYLIRKLHDVPGHIDAITNDPENAIISCHNLVGNYSYGQGRLLKIKINDLSIIDEFTCSDLVRNPNLSLFLYNNENFILTNGYPQRVFVIKYSDFSLYNKNHLGTKVKYADYSNGPYNVEAFTRTPFSVIPLNNTSLYFTVDPYQIKLRDFISNKVIGTFSYNFNKKNIMGTGHAVIIE